MKLVQRMDMISWRDKAFSNLNSAFLVEAASGLGKPNPAPGDA